MEKEAIIEAYAAIGIATCNLPEYEGPNEFAQNFRTCSLLVDVESVVSGSTTIVEPYLTK